MGNSGFIANQNKKGCVPTKFVGMLKNLKAQDDARIALGFRARVTKDRKCLQCDVVFISRNEARTCKHCRELNRYRAGIGE